MGGSKPVRRTRRLGSGWTTLEWSSFSGFGITMHTEGIRLRKRSAWIPWGETRAAHIEISWYQTIPYGDIQGKGRPGQTVEYDYEP